MTGRWSRLSAGLVLGFALALGSCASGGEMGQKGRTIAINQKLGPVTILTLRGELNETNVEEARMRMMLAPGRIIVRISSPGGSQRAALRLGQAIAQRNAEVIVEDICSSACALLVLPAASRVTVRRGAIISLHQNAVWWAATALKSGDAATLTEIAPYMEPILDLLAERGADLRIPYCAGQFLKAEQYARMPGEVDGLPNVTARTVWTDWLMSPNVLRAYGVKLEDGLDPLPAPDAPFGVRGAKDAPHHTLSDCRAMDTSAVDEMLRHLGR